MELKDYWASKPIEEIASEIEAKFEEYSVWLYKSGYAGRIKLCYDRFYGIDQDGTVIIETEEESGVSRININHYKNLIKRIHLLIVQSKLSFQPRSRNADASALIDTDLSKGLLEYYNDEKNMNAVFSEAVETSLICLESWVHAPWDQNAGDPVTRNDDEMIMQGDQVFEVLTALDVARNMKTDSEWHIVRSTVNKWVLAANYPKYQAEILDARIEPSHIDEIVLDPTISTHYDISTDQINDDLCYTFTLYHKKSKVMKDGRRVLICNGVVLEDSNLSYNKAPLYRLKSGNIIQTGMADSPSVDLLSVQEAINNLFSAVLSNNLNNAVQNIWTNDPNLTVRKISKTQNIIISAQEPKGINFTQSKEETYKLLDQLISNQQLLSGVNETTRGNPQASLKSGNSLALMLAQAIQFVSDLQMNYAKLAGNVGSCVLDNIKAFATTERVAYIVGVNKRSYAKIYKAEDLSDIDNVVVDLGNPILQSQAGRWELIQMFTQYGLVQDPKMIATFMKTGEMDHTLDDEFKDAVLIKQENEMLMKGYIPTVVITDIHPQHIQKHRSVFDDPEVRNNPRVMEAALAHIQEHIEKMREIDPNLAMILGIPQLPPEMPPGTPQAPPPGGDNIPEVNPGGVMPEGVNIPNVPPGTPPQVAQSYQQVVNATEQRGQ